MTAFYLLGLTGSRVLSPARPCQCLLWTGLSEQIQGTHRLLFSAKGNTAALGYTLNTLYLF